VAGGGAATRRSLRDATAVGVGGSPLLVDAPIYFSFFLARARGHTHQQRCS